jgi:3-oxoacyl-[acyl-carrier protein] reductase
MFNTMNLKNKNAVIYGAGGSLGGAVAKALAREGVRIFLTGRTLEPLQKLAEEIRVLGGTAEFNQVDAFNEESVKNNTQWIKQKGGSLDISFTAIDLQPVQNIPLVDMNTEDFVRPVSLAMHSHFITSVYAAKEMIKQRSGVILTLTATPGGIGYPFTGGFGPACSAIETLSQNLASEVGKYGVRVVNIRSAGSPDSKTFQDALRQNREIVEPILKTMEGDTMLKRLPPMEDIANVAVFLASSGANSITGVTIDVTAGTTAALNYKVTT